MDSMAFLYMLIEAIIFLIPLATALVKLGAFKKVVEEMEEKMKHYETFKTTTELKVAVLEKNDENQSELLQEINKQLIDISTKVGLILNDKIKKGE